MPGFLPIMSASCGYPWSGKASMLSGSFRMVFAGGFVFEPVFAFVFVEGFTFVVVLNVGS